MKQVISIFLLLFIANPALAFKQNKNIKKRCEDDFISSRQEAEERIRWYAKCFPNEIEDKSIDKTEEEQTISWINTYLYKDSDPAKGYQKSLHIPVFTDETLENTWVSPKDRNANCEVKEGFAARMFCKSDY